MSTKINVAECIRFLDEYAGDDHRLSDAARALELLAEYVRVVPNQRTTLEQRLSVHDKIAAELDLGGIGAKE